MRSTPYRHLLLLLALAVAPAFAPSLARAGEPKLVATEGPARLETIDGHRVLHVSGTPYEMGFQHGRLLAEEVKANVRSITENETKLGDRIEYKIYKTLREGMHERLLPHVPERFLEEIRGLAKGAGLPYESVLAANLFPEAFHCSGMALRGRATHDGSLYHVRILDYMTDAGLQENAVTILARPKTGHAFLNVSFAGFIGSVTGMNEQGISIGEIGGAGQLHWDGTPMCFLVRDVLERATHLEEARDLFRDAKRTCEYYYVIADGKIPDAYGVQATVRRIHFLEMGQPYAFLDLSGVPSKDSARRRVVPGEVKRNGKYVRQIDGPQGEVTIFEPPEDTVIVTGDKRFEAFCRRLEEHDGKVDEQSLQAMVRQPVSMKGNLHVAIFHPSTLTAWIAVAAADGSPACDQPYVEVRLQREEDAEPEEVTEVTGEE